MDHYDGKTSITIDEDFENVNTDKQIRLDIACGQNKKKGYIGVDISGDLDVSHDLTVYPWPFENNSVYEINCSHYVEHVRDLQSFVEECYRIMMPKGLLTITAPYYTSIRATQDFTHVRSINELTFQYFSQEWLKNMKLDHYNIACDFETLSTVLFFNPEWEGRAEEAKQWAAKHYWNVVNDIQVLLRRK